MQKTEDYIRKKLEDKYSLQLSEDLYHVSFFHPRIGFMARNMLDMVYEIEKELQIKFDEDTLASFEFTTFAGLVREIKRKTETGTGSCTM